MSNSALVVLCTAPNTEVAQGLARSLVDKRLAACVNIVGPIRSVYRWKGSVQDDEEVQLIIKTRADLSAEVEKLIAAEHPYDLPEFICLDAEASRAYGAWLQDEMRA